MFWSILHRTILWELVRVFLLSLIGITGMLLIAGIVDEASKQGLGPLQILAAIPLLVPSTLPYTIPATTLFATCVVYGRLAADNEILAIKAAGINILSIVSPAAILGIAMSSLTMVLYYDVIPTTHHYLRVMVVKNVEEFLYSILKRDHCIRQPKMNYWMIVKSVQGHRLIDALFVRRDPKTNTDDIMARADEAEMTVDLKSTPPQILIHMIRCTVVSSKDGPHGYFADKTWPVELGSDIANSGRKVRTGDMTWQELIEFRDEQVQQKEKIDAEMACVAVIESAPNSSPDLAKHLNNLRNASRHMQNEILNTGTEMLMRPALAVGCFCFVLVGCPIGMWFSKSDYLSAFITCFLPIVTFYYPLLLCGANIARTAAIWPPLAVWGANGIMGLVALPLYWKLMKN